MELIPDEKLPRIQHHEPAGIVVEPGKVYAWCACGLTGKTPFCDGSHKKIDPANGRFQNIKLQFDKQEEVWFCQCKQTKTPPFCDGSHKNFQGKIQ